MRAILKIMHTAWTVLCETAGISKSQRFFQYGGIKKDVSKNLRKNCYNFYSSIMVKEQFKESGVTKKM